MGTLSILAFASDPRRGWAASRRLGLLLITGMSPADRRGSLKAAPTVFAAPTKLPSAGLPRASLLRISGATVGAAGARATTGPREAAAAPTARFPGLASLAAQHNRAGAGGYFLVACVARRGPGALVGTGGLLRGGNGVRRGVRRKPELLCGSARATLPKSRETAHLCQIVDLAWHTSYPSSRER